MALEYHLDNPNSIQTILTYHKDDDNMSDWSVVWSTTIVPGMDEATGAGARRRKMGRRWLQSASLTLAGALSMHVRQPATALIMGSFSFIVVLIIAIAAVGNPVRHFEVYLGQWSISGPGRAFRIIPMLDGIGMLICTHALLRVTTCVTMAAISASYIISSVKDDRLPFTYCRTFDLTTYDSSVVYIQVFKGMAQPSSNLNMLQSDSEPNGDDAQWRRAYIDRFRTNVTGLSVLKRVPLMCKEEYNNYPPVFKTSPYNHFFIELMHYRTDHSITNFNWNLLILILAVYAAIWMVILYEKIKHGRIIWNNMHVWFGVIPGVWSCFIFYLGAHAFLSRPNAMRRGIRQSSMGNKEVLGCMIDAVVSALYIHASAVGSELIIGKGLNHFASGHIDGELNGEVMWVSSLVWLLSAISNCGVALCAMTDPMLRNVNTADESTMWVFPMYAKCALTMTKFSHLSATLVFAGLCFAYSLVAYVCLKSALHTIFEYKIKLVFMEQGVVLILLLICTLISSLYTTNAGLGLLEAMDAVLAGIVTPLIVLLETTCILYVYRGTDFVSDMNVATEENACAQRIGIQWQILPLICIVTIFLKVSSLTNAEIPMTFIWIGFFLVLLIILVLVLRAVYNTYSFLHTPGMRRKK